MSYCRWSSDNYQCDVYVYESSSGGWTTHVAGRRHVFDEPLPPYTELDEPESLRRWKEQDRVVRERMKRANLVDIGLEHDGATFNDPTPGECAGRLEMLRKAGYIVPQYAIDALREEQAEEVEA